LIDKINIAIVDDHPLFIEGIVSILKEDKQINIVGIALSGASLLELLQHNEVNVLLSDISMPGMNGLDLCKQIKKLYPNIGILMLTMHEEPRIISNLLKAGANGYLFKNSPKELIINAIKTIAGGSIFVSDDVKEKIVFNIANQPKQTPFVPKLSEREKQVLLLVSQQLTTQQIADTLIISHHTVLSHRKNLLQKFDVQNTAGLITKAIEAGLL
jgi:DNA-binding NarL/FixJ family response regulator